MEAKDGSMGKRGRGKRSRGEERGTYPDNVKFPELVNCPSVTTIWPGML